MHMNWVYLHDQNLINHFGSVIFSVSTSDCAKPTPVSGKGEHSPNAKAHSWHGVQLHQAAERAEGPAGHGYAGNRESGINLQVWTIKHVWHKLVTLLDFHENLCQLWRSCERCWTHIRGRPVQEDTPRWKKCTEAATCSAAQLVTKTTNSTAIL